MPTPYVQTPQAVLDRIAPLNPKEIKDLRTTIKERKEAFGERLDDRPPARQTSTQTTVDLSPGATPPLVRLAPNQGAALMFVDAAGRPWPVESADNFNGAAYSISQSSEHTFSIGMIQPVIGNVAFKLKDVTRPIVVTLKPAQDATDYNVDLVIPKFYGGMPPTALGSAAASPAYQSDELMQYLYRTPPKSARRLTTGGSSTGEVMAWQTSATTMVVRTSAMVLSPAWNRRQGSSDGVFVYEVPLTPVVMVSEGGEQRAISLGNISVEPNGNATSVAGAMLQGAMK